MSKAFENSQSFVPNGGIIMWSGKIVDIPQGWFLCDGTNKTPNMIDRFIYGTGTEDDMKATGGSADAVVVEHNHSGQTNSTGNHNHGWTAGANNGYPDGSGDRTSNYYLMYAQTNNRGQHSHSVSISQSGESGTNKNLPPFMKLAYIMKGTD